MLVEGRKLFAEPGRDQAPTRRAEADADRAVHLGGTLFDAAHRLVLHPVDEHALATLNGLGGLAQERMTPERRLEPLREAEFDDAVLHRGALGEQVGRIETDVAGFVGDRPPFVDGLDEIARLQLREIGVPLGRAGRRVGFHDATVTLQDSPAENPKRRAAKEIGWLGLGVLLDVGRSAHAAYVEQKGVHDTGGLDVVSLGVG